jgi:cytochrome c-type biogenesis protein CcmE
MTPKQKQRLALVLGALVGVSAIVGLIMYAIGENLDAFYSPSQVVAGEAAGRATFRLGGLVEQGSVQREPGQLKVSFALTDCVEEVRVSYEGVLPDLFREGQGVIVTGGLDAQGHFQASEVLAKHDENYMPPEVADTVKNKALCRHPTSPVTP